MNDTINHPCYFCRNQETSIRDESGYSNWFCETCMQKYDLSVVCTTYHAVIPVYFHIYISPSPGISHHVRYHADEKITYIASGKLKEITPQGKHLYAYQTDKAMEISGFFITPENIRKRLPTILTFS